MLDERISAIRAVKQASMDLSAACLEKLRVPGEVSPLVKLYDDYLLQQPVDLGMASLLGRIR